MLELVYKYLCLEARLARERLKLLWLLLLRNMPPFVMETRHVRRLERVAGNLQAMHAKITLFEKRILEGCYREEIDGDDSIRAMLRGLKEDIRAVRLDLSAMQEMNRRGLHGARLERALLALRKVAEETYRAADRLLWEIDQHDLAYRRA